VSVSFLFHVVPSRPTCPRREDDRLVNLAGFLYRFLPTARFSSSNGIFRVYYGLIVGGAALYLFLHPFHPSSPWGLVAGFGLLMAATELLPVWLPRGGFATPTSAVDLAALLVLGPVTTAWLVAASSLLTQLGSQSLDERNQNPSLDLDLFDQRNVRTSLLFKRS